MFPNVKVAGVEEDDVFPNVKPIGCEAEDEAFPNEKLVGIDVSAAAENEAFPNEKPTGVEGSAAVEDEAARPNEKPVGVEGDDPNGRPPRDDLEILGDGDGLALEDDNGNRNRLVELDALFADKGIPAEKVPVGPFAPVVAGLGHVPPTADGIVRPS